ncbi:MAG: restriction endonuclease subunit S, partial [Methylobacter sp.]|nr:restriction endonuclease subunit S [Candidatus Methylobacter titanis]
TGLEGIERTQGCLCVTSVVLSEINDVIIPASGETQIDIATASCVQVSGVALGGDLNIIKSQENGVFLTYYLNNQKKLDIAKLAQGNSVVHLYSSQLKQLDLNLPDKKEQTKIANFLTAVDEKITQLTQKTELLAQYKKGVMQQIFSQELRFKDEDGREFPEWVEKELREIGSFFSGGTPLTTRKDFYDGEIPFIKSGELGLNSTAQYITELGLKNSSAKMVNIGDLLYALYGATSGELAISKIEGAINQAILCIRTNLNTYFLYSYLLFKKQSILQSYLQGGQGNLSAEIIKSLDVPTPSLKEQTKIANFLTALDEKFTQNQSQLNALKQYKQGLLQQMFV